MCFQPVTQTEKNKTIRIRQNKRIEVATMNEYFRIELDRADYLAKDWSGSKGVKEIVVDVNEIEGDGLGVTVSGNILASVDDFDHIVFEDIPEPFRLRGDESLTTRIYSIMAENIEDLENKLGFEIGKRKHMSEDALKAFTEVYLESGAHDYTSFLDNASQEMWQELDKYQLTGSQIKQAIDDMNHFDDKTLDDKSERMAPDASVDDTIVKDNDTSESNAAVYTEEEGKEAFKKAYIESGAHTFREFNEKVDRDVLISLGKYNITLESVQDMITEINQENQVETERAFAREHIISGLADPNDYGIPNDRANEIKEDIHKYESLQSRRAVVNREIDKAHARNDARTDRDVSSLSFERQSLVHEMNQLDGYYHIRAALDEKNDREFALEVSTVEPPNLPGVSRSVYNQHLSDFGPVTEDNLDNFMDELSYHQDDGLHM